MAVDYFSAGFKASDLGKRCVDKREPVCRLDVALEMFVIKMA